ncbi:DNA topoisomerase [Trifolium repens]|nr:DNA topoisomerase [Trifolium repens]
MASIRYSSSNSRSCNNSRYSTSFSRNDLAPDCLCQVKAVIRTVGKEGPNKGKKIWGCRNFVNREVDCGCGFFYWYSEQENQTPICKECSKKDMENATLKKTIMKMHENDKSTKNNMKLLIINCLLLTIICVIFMCLLVLM